MVHESSILSREGTDILRWAARVGAVTAEALAEVQGSPLASARAQLAVAERRGLLVGQRPLAAYPRLYTLTRAGLRHCGERGLEPCRVSVSRALHLVTCAMVAARLERRYPCTRVMGEYELRRDERAQGRALASARLRIAPGGHPLLHRPDLVLWPTASKGSSATGVDGLPVAVEVELTVKAPRRLREIVAAWARCRLVSGVIYVATPEVEHALARALDRAQASAQVTVVPLAALGR